MLRRRRRDFSADAHTVPAVGLSATCVWRVDGDLVLALDARLGPPIDSYVNGSQTWLADGPGDITLEWRLHPVASYRAPSGLSHYDLWEAVVAALVEGADEDELELGTEHRALGSLWDGLECFAAYGEDIEPAPLARAAGDTLGRAPSAGGLVDHDRIGEAWEHSRGAVSIVGMLLAELRSGETDDTDDDTDDDDTDGRDEPDVADGPDEPGG
jgi:hypothetical protein